MGQELRVSKGAKGMKSTWAIGPLKLVLPEHVVENHFVVINEGRIFQICEARGNQLFSNDDDRRYSETAASRANNF